MKLRKVKKRYFVILSIVLVLLIARLTMPYFVTRFVNGVLAEIPGYTGSIAGVKIRLIRGAYIIEDLKLYKVEGNTQIPFVDIPTTDLSVEWSAIFKGALVGKITVNNPIVNFIGGDKKDASGRTTNQIGENVDWIVPIKKLMPLQINRFVINDGAVFFYDFTTTPEVSLHLKQFQVLATNLNNADDQRVPLPSKITATAVSTGNGQLTIVMDINVLKEIPDVDMNLKFETINMHALNDFFLAYAKVDVEKGTFDLYSELVIKDGLLNGHVKPLARDVALVSREVDKDKPLNQAWQSIVAFFVDIFTHQEKDQVATKAPMEGDLNDVKSEVWPTLLNIFKDAFVKAFEKNTDNTIKFAPRKIQESKKEKRQREKSKKKSDGAS